MNDSTHSFRTMCLQLWLMCACLEILKEELPRIHENASPPSSIGFILRSFNKRLISKVTVW